MADPTRAAILRIVNGDRADSVTTAGWRERLVSAREAVAEVRSGDHVFVGTACATPRMLVATLEDLDTPVSDLLLVHFLTDGVVPVYKGGPSTRFRHRVFFVGSDTRAFVEKGKVDYVPVSIARVPRLIADARIPIDVALIQVSPPDEEGNCSLGVSVDIIPAAIAAAKQVIAEINPNMPRTHGESSIPFADIDYAVAVDSPVIEYLHEAADEVGKQVARYVARIIDDGSTLQIGLGRIPNEMLKYLTNRKDLGVHSDVITEPLVDLIDKGVVTGKRKTLYAGQVVASYCMGSRRLYDLIDGNPLFNFRRIEEICDPEQIARNHKMVSVTQAFAVDLGGQVCADQFEGSLYSGVSSQPEFLRGAAASEGGRPIICLASTTDDGKQSRIRPLLREGEGVTIARSDVHYVVTEYGIAYLFGKSVRERALALIEIAHPSFREELLEEARRLAHVPKKQILKSRKAYPEEEEREVELKDGRKILLRPTRASDVDGMQELFYSLTERDIYTRFFTNLKSFSASQAQHLCSVSYEEEMAFLAVVGDWEEEKVIGSGCYYADPSTNLADVAYMIHPEWQGLGLGGRIQQRLVEYAKTKGLRGFTADVLSENEKMLAVFEKGGFKVSSKVVEGTFEVVMLFD
jgi:acyl-CoA hydrolase/RimJ/RimL family protein N-acetyltransferase